MGIFANLIIPSGKKEDSYQGALTGLYKRGRFNNLFKVDFSGMYPSAIQTWNIGPDTTRLVEVKPYTGIYKFCVVGKYNWYTIPDEKFNADLVISVRNDIDGFLKQGIIDLRKQRASLKSEMKKYKSGTSDYMKLNSQQNAIKVIMNTIYGVLGNQNMLYGDMISALMVTAMCRWTTGRVIRKYRDSLVELDTDGLIIDSDTDVDALNNELDELICNTFQVKENMMHLEKDEIGDGYFYKIKNYILKDEHGYTIHGSSLKSSKAAKVVDRALKLALEHVFNNKPVEEVINEAYDFTGLDLSWFTERVKLSKEQREYSNDKSMHVFLAKQMEFKTKQPCTEGTQVTYVVTRTQLKETDFIYYYNKKSSAKSWNYTFIKLCNGLHELDYEYYNILIDKALEKFGIFKPKTHQLDIFQNTEFAPIEAIEPLDIIPPGDNDWTIVKNEN